MLPVIAMIGVRKAGAAWALVEDTYAPERIAYIRQDCGCRVEFSADNWDDIMRTEPLEGFEKVDGHDAAYAIYTSGTTGNPKGVLHEYGNLNQAVDSIRRLNGEIPFNGWDRLATLAPMNFVAAVIVILAALNVFRGKNFIVSYATIKNPGALAKFFLSKRITITFLTPSCVRMLGNTTGPFLRMLFVGSEPANNLYNKNLDLINIYACSESGFAVGVFKIDKACETCPIGKPSLDTKITLLAEDGSEAAEGEMGELCFENPYVRGCINLPEETEKAFVNGVCHTGDLVRTDEKGNYILLGRSNDMIKINGNRIEPAETEAAVKQVLGIDWAAAKGIEDGDKSCLCAYCTADIEVDAEALRNELMKRLPYYIIPSCYLKIDSVPLKLNGKLDRKALPTPDARDFMSDYAAPTNELAEGHRAQLLSLCGPAQSGGRGRERVSALSAGHPGYGRSRGLRHRDHRVRQNQAASQTILDMEILDGADGLELMVDFAASRYNEASIEKFKDIYVKLAQALVTHNSQKDVTVGEIKEKIRDKKSFFQVVKGIFSRKK